MLRVALKAAAPNADVPYVHGMTAFAYEQCHLLDEAESEARTALEMRRKEPWAQHALAHVFLTRGRIDEGARFLEEVADTWTGLNSFMVTHLWWHLALFYLSQGRDGRVLDLYDRHCWGIAKDYSQDQIGAVSLLARCEIAGIDVGPRWQDLGRSSGGARAGHGAAVPDASIPLRIGAGGASGGGYCCSKRCGAARRAAPAFSRRCGGMSRCRPARGCMPTRAATTPAPGATWQPRVPRMAEAGGSHAQRDLFEQFLLDAAIKSGRMAAAQQMLELRRLRIPTACRSTRRLAAVYAKLGLRELADQARATSRARPAQRHPA